MSNLHPIFEQITRGMQQSAAWSEYVAGLSRFDWQYMFSDDRLIYSHWLAEHRRLSEMQRDLDPDGTTWERFRRDGGNGAPFPIGGGRKALPQLERGAA